MYILSISKKAFIRLEENGDTTIISNPEKATTFEAIGDAMKTASRVNYDLESTVVRVISL